MRSDYHMEAGEVHAVGPTPARPSMLITRVHVGVHAAWSQELFYQVKGGMVLKVVEHGVHKDIPIAEGEFFLLPPRVPHSPQVRAS